jgi:hypothetical protein
MNVSKIYLEKKIKELNEWLQDNNPAHHQYNLKKQNRDYYVNKLIELEESGAPTVKI